MGGSRAPSPAPFTRGKAPWATISSSRRRRRPHTGRPRRDATRGTPLTPVVLDFEGGTLLAPSLPEDALLARLFVHDTRTGVWRAPAWR
ncbi:MAG: hypothetical protein L0Y66_27045, partial [Myxococcaceae bacterium]|nr:hypothetical protein [Myxococcaceae bacterium]